MICLAIALADPAYTTTPPQDVKGVVTLVMFGVIGIALLLVGAYERVMALTPFTVKKKLFSYIFFFLLFQLISPSSYSFFATVAIYGLLILLTELSDAIFRGSIEKTWNVFLDSLHQKNISKSKVRLRLLRAVSTSLFYLAVGLFMIVVSYFSLEPIIVAPGTYAYAFQPYHVYTALILFGEQIYMYYQDRKEWYSKHVNNS